MDDLDCILCSTEVKKPRLCCQCSKLFCYECLFALYSQHELVTDTGNSAITSSVITAAVGLPAPTAATSTAAAAKTTTIAAAVLDLHDSVVTRTAITGPAQATITAAFDSLRATTSSTTMGPTDATIVPGVVALHALRASAAALCASVSAGVPISHITCNRVVHTASGLTAFSTTSDNRPIASSIASTASNATTSSRASAASSAASIYSRLRPCPNCNREQKLENYVKADFIEEIAKKLKEKDEQLVAKEKRIADRCAIHNEQKLFFCHTCEETKCHKCQKTCCANVNGKVYIEDVKDEVDNLWCAAKVKFSQLQVNDCTHSVSLETCQ